MITAERVRELFIIDAETGRIVWRTHQHRTDLIGQEAGYISEGRWKVAVDGRNYYRSHIVWLHFYGAYPELIPDHKDLNPMNDGISNLRLATNSQNGANKLKRSDNKSGLKGVSFCSKSEKWRADIQVRGKRMNLGRFETKQEAAEAYLQAAKEAFGEFARVA